MTTSPFTEPTALNTFMGNLPVTTAAPKTTKPPVTPATPAPVSSPVVATPPVTPAVTPPVVPTTPVTQPATNPTTPSTQQTDFTQATHFTPTDTTPTTTTLADQADRDALKQAQQQYQTQAKQVQDTITGIQNGSMPLSTGENAQLDGLKSQFQTLIDQQTQDNASLKIGRSMLDARMGIMQYQPGTYLNDIHKVVSDGITKVAALQTQEASAVAQLTQSLKDNDIKAVQDSWSAYQAASKERTDALSQTIKDTQDAITAAQTEADKQQTYQLDVAKFNQTGDQNAFDNALKAEQAKTAEAAQAETVRHNKATEGLDAFKAGLGAGGGSNGVTQSAQITASGNPDPATQKAVLDQITAKYGPMTATAIQGLANYSLNPADWSARAGTKGLSKADAVALAQMYDPTYSDTNYAIRAAYLKSISSTQTGTVGSAVNAANKSINHLTTFATLMNQMTTPGTAGARNSNTLAQAQTAALGVSEELAKFFKGSGTVDVGSIDAWQKQINPNTINRGAVQGTVQSAVDLLAGQLQTLTEQYQNTMGKAPETDFLGTSARASLSNLKNQGYQVDIPGINYTDKDAYMKYVPDAQANMTNAVTALTNVGLPVTPENILQAAQEMN